jgi:hypothetical protein
METPPLKRCLNCSELIHPDSFGSECNPTPVEASTEEFIYVDWIPLFKWPQEIKND